MKDYTCVHLNTLGIDYCVSLPDFFTCRSLNKGSPPETARCVRYNDHPYMDIFQDLDPSVIVGA